MTKLLSIRQAAAQGIKRLRQPAWFHRLAHVELDLDESCVRLHRPWASKDPTVHNIADLDIDAEIYEPYLNATHDSLEYEYAAVGLPPRSK